MGLSRRDLAALGLLLLFGLLLLGFTVPFAGLHLDDFGLERLFSGARAEVWRMFLDYVPGRNLFVLYAAGLYAVCGHDPVHLHMVGLACDLLNIGLYYALLRRLGASTRWALIAAGLFLVYPNHGETHFWMFGIAQNLIPVTLILCSALWISADGMKRATRFGGALGIFLLALFDYDQAFLLWIPILMIGLSPERGPGLGAAALVAGFCLSGDLSHVLFRHLAKISAGGRPVILWSRPWASALSAARALLVPMVRLPRYQFLAIGPFAPWVVAILCALAGMVWALVASRSADDGQPAPAQLRMVLIGLAWTACAYFPNLFWYLSPRHHYLPTAGWLMALAGAGSLVGPRLSDAVRRVVCVAAAIAFGLAASFDFAEGRAWRASACLLDDLSIELHRGEPADNIYVLGAPVSMGPAPALSAPAEADFAAVGDGPKLLFDSIAPSFSRRGVFASTESDLLGDDKWTWRPYVGARVVVYDPQAGFSRVGRLHLEPPGAPPIDVDLGGGRGSARLRPLVWLMEARAVPEPEHQALASASGIALEGAGLRQLADGALDLELSWRGAPGKDRAFLIALDDAAGRLFTPRRWPKGGRETIWPAYDDLVPAGTWRNGETIRETWRLDSSRAPIGKVVLSLRLFEPSGTGRWSEIGALSAPVNVSPAR